ncbi:MAG: hypothetical protein AB1665_09210 [Candidatus Thermoplasmatota archaeon]
MASKRAPKPEAKGSEKELERLSSRLAEQGRRVRSLEKRLETRIKREDIILQALGISTAPGRRDHGTKLDDIMSSLLKLEEQLIATSRRLENILSALKNHREFLIRLNRKVFRANPKEMIKVELDIMKNTLSILALSGYEFDRTIFTEIKRLANLLEREDVEMAKIQKRKERLDKRFEDEVGRLDWEALYLKKGEIPGYV